MLLADEDIERLIVERLRADGFDVLWIAETAPGATDVEVLTLANNEDRILLTADKGFGELVFRQRQVAAGVVLVRVLGTTPAQRAEIVADAIAAHRDELRGAFTVITPAFVRIRRT